MLNWCKMVYKPKYGDDAAEAIRKGATWKAVHEILVGEGVEIAYASFRQTMQRHYPDLKKDKYQKLFKKSSTTKNGMVDDKSSATESKNEVTQNDMPVKKEISTEKPKLPEAEKAVKNDAGETLQPDEQQKTDDQNDVSFSDFYNNFSPTRYQKKEK